MILVVIESCLCKDFDYSYSYIDWDVLINTFVDQFLKAIEDMDWVLDKKDGEFIKGSDTYKTFHESSHGCVQHP